MSNMERIKQYIENNIELIDANKWEEFFLHVPRELRGTTGIGAILYDVGIDFLLFLTKIPRGAFEHFSELKSIDIPTNIKNIGDYAFYECTGLVNVTIPNSVTSIGYCAFSACRRLTSITIPDSVTSIGAFAFHNCTGLMNIILGKDLTIIDHDAFYSCSNVKNIKISNSNIEIRNDAFSNINDVEINYFGTKEQWKSIYNKNAFKGTYFTVHCTDGNIIKRKR